MRGTSPVRGASTWTTQRSTDPPLALGGGKPPVCDSCLFYPRISLTPYPAACFAPPQREAAIFSAQRRNQAVIVDHPRYPSGNSSP